MAAQGFEHLLLLMPASIFDTFPQRPAIATYFFTLALSTPDNAHFLSWLSVELCPEIDSLDWMGLEMPTGVSEPNAKKQI